MSESTVDVLFERGILQVGDTLVCDQHTIVEETAVTVETIESVDPSPEFWQCEVTTQTKNTHEVRYRLDDDHYGLASLVTRIIDDLASEKTTISMRSPETYWCHPAFGHRTLWNLRITNMR